MAEITLQDSYRVDLIESERGWGSKIDETKYFDSEDSAEEYCEEFNKQNDKTEVPDWYMYAEYVGKVN